MRLATVLRWLVLSLPVAVAAGVPVATADPAAAPSAAAIRAHMEFLADDLLEGRSAGTDGYGIAAAYVASVFRSLGLAPAGDDGGWFQDYRVIESRLVPGSGRVILTRNGGDEPLEFDRDFMMGGDYLSRAATVTAPATFVGFGVTAPDLGYDDYAGVDVGGRIVVMFGGAPSRFPHDQRAYYSSTRVKLDNAVARGAIGVLFCFTDDFLERNPWPEIVDSYAFPGMRWVGADGTVAGTWPEIRGAAVLSPAGLARLLADSGHDPAAVQARAAAGETGSFELPGTVTLERASTHRTMTDRNVAGLLPGGDPALRDEVVVITGHLDHIGIGPEVDGDAIYNGYYDNAAGIAVMLESARLLARSPARPARSVLFLAVGAEEKGLLGSDYFAEYPTVDRDALVANVNFDMPLFLYPLADVVAYGAEHSSLQAPSAAAAQAVDLILSPDPMPEEVIFIRSDQFSLIRRGVPAVYLMPGFRSRDPDIDGAQVFGEFLRRRYHKPGDAPGLPFHDESAVRFVAMNVHLIRAIADDPQRPRWNDGDFFGEMFGPGAERSPAGRPGDGGRERVRTEANER